MRPLSLYLDSSAIGGYFDAEFMDDTRALWRLREAGSFRFFCSALVEKEISSAPERVRELMKKGFHPADILPPNAEALELADRYVAHGIIPMAYQSDAQHVALCTLARLDYLVSWNFKHLTNARREAGFNAVNLLQGCQPVHIV